MPAATANPLHADLVLEGGGVKGLGLVGAVTALGAAGYTFPRIAGSSAGSVVAAFVAALQRAGEPVERLADVALELDYRRFRDRGPLARFAGPLGPVVDLFSLIFENGLYEGDYLHRLVEGRLRDLGVETFGDLRLPPDPDGALPEGQRYRLVVVASDVSRQRLVRLPWDYPLYGLDPDEQRVADAVRASASIPFFFEPVAMRWPAERGVATLVDGGVLSNFPIWLFDRGDGRPPRWPTFGVRLSARDREPPRTEPVKGPVSLALSVVETMMEALDARHVDDPCVQARSIFVDSAHVSAVDFGITEEQQRELFDRGRTATATFLERWDFPAYVERCRAGEAL